jgi:3-phosphoshikimate 1-carboxyvinyltransferase
MTVDWLRRQGIEFETSQDMLEFKIKGRQSYKAFDMTIPADFSTATFPLAAAAMTGGEVFIADLDFDDKQGDKELFRHFQRMGAEIERKDGGAFVRGSGKLAGMEIDLNATPDALPAMAAAACAAEGRTALVNVPQARIKETDRIACMTRELRKMGAKIEELPDGMIIEGTALKGAVVDSHADHRIAMALALAGMTAGGETVVTGAECAAVTYPDFVSHFKALGAGFTEG